MALAISVITQNKSSYFNKSLLFYTIQTSTSQLELNAQLYVSTITSLSLRHKLEPIIEQKLLVSTNDNPSCVLLIKSYLSDFN